MTTKQRVRATDTGMPDETRATAREVLFGLPQCPALPIGSVAEIRARISQFCEWFELEVPKTRSHRGDILMTDELFKWLTTSGASWDWIVSGDARAMATVARRIWLEQLEVIDAFRGASDLRRKQATAFLKTVATARPGPRASSAFAEAFYANPDMPDEEFDRLLAALAAADIEALASAGPDRIMALFAEWQRKIAEANAESCTEERSAALLEEANAVEDRMMEIPATTAQELAAKILAWTANGGHDLSKSSAPALWADIRRLAEVEHQPVDHGAHG